MTFDGTLRIAELIAVLGVAGPFVRGTMGLRDAVIKMTDAVERLDRRSEDHEDRIRSLEFGDRRSGIDRRH